MQELQEKLSVKAPLRLGWTLFLGGLIVWVLYAVYLFVTGPEMPSWQKLMVGAFVIGFVLLLISVARQRWLEWPHDRYKGVRK